MVKDNKRKKNNIHIQLDHMKEVNINISHKKINQN